jgi:hypothetical protein
MMIVMDVDLYLQCLANGCSERLAEMLASHRFPGTKGTDRAFFQGRPLGVGQFADVPLVARHHERIAEDAGVSTVGKAYLGTLARYPGDPEAWVSDLHDVRTKCEERGWGCDGAIKVEAREGEMTSGRYRVADDIVEAHVDDEIAEDPALAPRRDEVRAELATKLGGVHG